MRNKPAWSDRLLLLSVNDNVGPL